MSYTDKNKKRIHNFKYKYNINLPSNYYENKYKMQNGLCAICERPRNKFKKDFALDHNHRNNKLRGLLCDDCNRSLGHLERRKIDGLWFINALSYLLKYESIDLNLYKTKINELKDLINSLNLDKLEINPDMQKEIIDKLEIKSN